MPQGSSTMAPGRQGYGMRTERGNGVDNKPEAPANGPGRSRLQTPFAGASGLWIRRLPGRGRPEQFPSSSAALTRMSAGAQIPTKRGSPSEE